MAFYMPSIFQLIAHEGNYNTNRPLGYKVAREEKMAPPSEKSRYVKRENKKVSKPKREPREKRKTNNKQYRTKDVKALTKEEKKQKKYDRLGPKLLYYDGPEWKIKVKMFKAFDARKDQIYVLGKKTGFALICCWYVNKLNCGLPREILKMIYWKLFDPDEYKPCYLYCGPLKEPRGYYVTCFNCRKFLLEVAHTIKRDIKTTPRGYPLTLHFCDDPFCVSQITKK